MRKSGFESAEEWQTRNTATLNSIFHLLLKNSYMFKGLVTKTGEGIQIGDRGYVHDSDGRSFRPTHLYPLATLKDGRRLVWLCSHGSSSVIAAIPAATTKLSHLDEEKFKLNTGEIEQIDAEDPPELQERAIEILHRIVNAVKRWSEAAREEYELSLWAAGALHGIKTEHDQDWYELEHPPHSH